MYLFIATIFIAELIIFGFILRLLILGDKKINCCRTYALNCGNDIIKTVQEVKGILITTQNILGKATEFVIKKRKEMKNKLINMAFIYMIILVFKMKFKRAATVLQYLLILKDFWASIPSR